MLALEASDALRRAAAFPVNDMTPELVNEAVKLTGNILVMYYELIEPLNESGRKDLAQAVESKIVEFYQNQKKEKWKKRTIDPIIEFDKKYFNGKIKKLKNRLFDN